MGGKKMVKGGVIILFLSIILISFASAVTITLNSPTNNSNLSSSSVIFNGTTMVNASNALKNISLILDGIRNQTNSSGINDTEYLFTKSLADGNHDWFYMACDVLDFCFNAPQFSLLIDTIFPSISYSSQTSANNSNVSQNWIFVNISVNETNFNNITYYLYNFSGLVNSTTYFTLINSTNFTGLSDGFYDYNVTIYDIAGNKNTTPTRTIKLDTTLSTLNSSNISGTYFNGSDFIFSPANQDGFFDSATIIMNASELIKDWGTIFIYNSTDKVDRFNADNNFYNFSRMEIWDGNFSPSYGSGFVPDGLYTIFTNLTDTANNTNEVFVATIFVDNTPPQVVSFNGNVQNNSILSEASGTNLVNITLNESVTIVSGVLFNLTSSGFVSLFTATNSSPNDWQYAINTSLFSDGKYNLTIIANDSVGNINNAIKISLAIDNTSPNVTINLPVNNSNLSGTKTLNATANDTNGIQAVFFSIGNMSYPAKNSTGNWLNDSFDTAIFSDGFYELNVTAIDFLNNVNSTEKIQILIDNTGPNIFNLTQTQSPIYKDNDVTLNANVSDVFLQVSGVWISANFTGNFVNYSATFSGGDNYFFFISSGNFSNQEIVEYQWFANDSLGNIANSSMQSFLIDNRIPDFVNGPIQNLTFDENGNSQQINLSNYFSDLDNDSLIFGPSSLQNFSSYSISNGVLTLAPTLGYSGITQTTFFANDSLNLTYSNIITIVVNDVNNPPRSGKIPNITFNEDSYNDSIDLANFFSDDDGIIVSYNFTNGNNLDNISISFNGSKINVSSDANWYGNASLYFIALDDSQDIGTSNKVSIIVNSVNDLPTIPSLLNPTNQTTIFSNSVILSWTSSTDNDEDTITYYLFLSNNSNPAINASTTNTQISISGLEHNQNYYWYVVVSDGFENQTKTETRIFNVSLKNSPTIDSFSPSIANISITESDSKLFSVNASDIDTGDVLTYSWTLNENSVGGNSNSFNFTTNFSSFGNYMLNASVTDSFGFIDSQSWAIFVINNELQGITGFSPLESEPVIKQNETQQFSISVSDLEGDVLSYQWFVNGVLNSTSGNNFSYTTSSLSNFNVSVFVTDEGNNVISKSWNLIVTNTPVASIFTEDETTNISGISNLSSVSNFTLENSDGKIIFDESVDLTDVLDLNNNVIIQNGIIAINTSKYPQLNKKATITLEGVSYTSVPKIFYTDKFTSNSNEINQLCDFCNILNYTNFPTANGIIVFEVEHFSSFIVGESGEVFDLNSLENLKRCVSGEQGNFILDLENPDEEDEFAPDEIIDVEANIKNQNSDNKRIIFKAILYNIDEDKEEEDTNVQEIINKNEDEDFELSLKIPDDIDNSDDFILFVKAYEKDNQDEQCSEDALILNIEREKHKVQIKNMIVNPEIVYPGQNVEVVVEVENIGRNEEDAYVILNIPEFGISETSEKFQLEEFDEDDSYDRIFSFRIPEDAEAGTYDINAKVFYEDGSDEETKTISVFKKIILRTTGDFTRDVSEEDIYETGKLEEKQITQNSYEELNKINVYLVIVNLLIGIVILFVVIIRRR